MTLGADLLIGAALLYLAAINGVTWLAFAADKTAAQQGQRRIAESTLLSFALLQAGAMALIGAKELGLY